MSVADQKVKAAMERIKARRKEGWLQHMLTEVERIDAGINDLHKVGDNLDKLEEVFKTIDTKLNDEKSKDNSNLYKEIYSDLSGAIKEHMHILTNHAKEQLAKEMEEE